MSAKKKKRRAGTPAERRGSKPRAGGTEAQLRNLASGRWLLLVPGLAISRWWH
jgi:hypothetical protein